MTLSLLKSQVDLLPFDFEQAVKDFIASKNEHRFSGGPAPVANGLIEGAVRRIQYPVEDQKPDEFVADYEIVDDTPPGPTLAERKTEAINASRLREADEIAAIVPPGKFRLMEMDAQRAYRTPEAERTPEQIKTIADRVALDAQFEQVHYDGAVREAEIDGWTE